MKKDNSKSIQTDQSAESPIQTIFRWFDALNRHDVEGVVACFHPQVEGKWIGHPDRDSNGGREHVRKNYTMMMETTPDMHSKILNWVEDGDTVWLEFRGGGNQVTVVGIMICKIEDGLVRTVRLFEEEEVLEGAGQDAFMRSLYDRPTPTTGQ